jgi:hypothetical protein
MKEKIKGFSDPRLVGREVYVRDVKMVISKINDSHTMCIKKEYGINRSFLHDGRHTSIDLLPILSFTPYTVEINENGQVTIKGYSDEIELESEDKPKEGDCGWFWDSEYCRYFRYGTIARISSAYYIGTAPYKNFSKTCPEWIKEIVNK